MTITRQNVFEGGSAGSAVTTGNSGGTSGDAWDAVTVTAPATVNYDSTAGRGSLAAQVATGASVAAYMEWQNTSLNAGVSSYLTILIRRSSLPTASLYPIRGLSTGGATAFRLRITTSGTLTVEDSAGSVWSGSSVIPTGSYFRVEIRVKPNSTPANGEIECRYFSSATGTVATESSGTVTANLGTDVDKLRFGNTSANNNGTTYYDDIAFGTGGFLGALGGSSGASVTPIKITTVSDVPDPVEQTGYTVTPAKVTTTAAVPTAGVSTASGTSATVVASTVGTAAGVMSIATVRSNSLLDASTVLTQATVNTPAAIGTAAFTVATPAKITTASTVPALTVSLGGSVTVTPGRIDSTSFVNDPDSVTAGSATTVTPATVTTTATVPGVLVASSSVAFAATVITTTTTTVGVVDVTTSANLYLFRTPIRQPQGPRYTVDSSPRQKALYRHIHHHGGYPVAVLISRTGQVSELAVPSVDDINNAAVAYLGGRDNVVSGLAATLLADAGYDLLTIGAVVPDPGTDTDTDLAGYGSGGYGEGGYGF